MTPEARAALQQTKVELEAKAPEGAAPDPFAGEAAPDGREHPDAAQKTGKKARKKAAKAARKAARAEAMAAEAEAGERRSRRG